MMSIPHLYILSQKPTMQIFRLSVCAFCTQKAAFSLKNAPIFRIKIHFLCKSTPLAHARARYNIKENKAPLSLFSALVKIIPKSLQKGIDFSVIKC